MAPQHRRGAAHTVKDEDLTHTEYDSYNREQLLAAVKEAGCYVKDDKKSVMARKLAEHDRNKRYEASQAAQKRKEKEAARRQEIASAARAQRDRRAARAKRNEARSTRYEQGDEVSSNSDDTDEDQDRCDAHKLTVTGGLVLSDETWEDTCSETTVRSENPPIRPACRLQLFEWPYPQPPLSSQPELKDEQYPALLPYAPLKLVTTLTHEKFTLPGKAYPAGAEPAYVPKLDALTRAAARHGHLTNQLSRAVVEPANLWAARTTVQGWNGRMYFSLPAQSQYETKHGNTLDEVYRRHHTTNQKLLQSTPGATDVRLDRLSRFTQIKSNKRKRVAEVYEASLWKPKALGYLPAYLDWTAATSRLEVAESDRTVENLWYVRFPGCDVPHYYFWSLPGRYSNPSVPDPNWSVDKYLSSKKIRVKKLTAPPELEDRPFGSQPLSFEDTFRQIEEHLIRHGLAFTLASYRAHALAAGKARAWTFFSHPLLGMYPSGAVPRAPPVQASEEFCVAAKIALLLDSQDVPPYTGEEGWTRDDDGAWDVVSDPGHEGFDAEDAMGSESLMVDGKEDGASQALYRRSSFDALPLRTSSSSSKDENKRIWTWLDSNAYTYPPPSTPLSSDTVGLGEPISPLHLTGLKTTPTCPFCSLAWLEMPEWEKAAHMLSHSHISTVPLTSTWKEDVMSRGVKRRHSLLTSRTLESYQRRFGGRKMVRVDSGKGIVGDARSLAGSLAERIREQVVEPLMLEMQKTQRERSPFSKERRRARAMRGLQVGCGEGRGARGWMLERAQSELGTEDWYDETAIYEPVNECDGESVWFGDDDM